MTTTESAPVLEVRDVTRRFGALMAVNGVNFALRPGERRAIIGPNGAGKTTLFNLIAGELPVSSGRVMLDGRDVTRMPSFKRCQLGLGRTFQRNNLFLGLTVEENVRIAIRRCRRVAADWLRPASSDVATQTDANALLTRLALDSRAKARARDLSYGEQRQLEIALALATGPRLLLLDEPTAGMSPAETAGMTALIQSLPSDITVLIIEHDMDVVFALADRITVLHYGEVLADGSPTDVRANSAVQEAYLGGPASPTQNFHTTASV